MHTGALQLAIGGTIALAAPTWSAAAAQVACPVQPPMAVAVIAEHRPPPVVSSFSYKQLRDMAEQAGYKGPHPGFGLYAGTFGYSVDVQAAEAGPAGCVTSIQVTVRMLLGDRRIEVASGGPCRPDIVAAHYLQHAAHDDRLLTEYGSRALAMFDRMPHADLLGDMRGGADRDIVAGIVRRAMDTLLASYDDDRDRALAAADSAEELQRLRRSCGQA